MFIFVSDRILSHSPQCRLNGIVWVNWEPIIGIPDLDGFKIWRSINNVEFYLIVTVGRNVTEYEDHGVTNGET